MINGLNEALDHRWVRDVNDSRYLFEQISGKRGGKTETRRGVRDNYQPPTRALRVNLVIRMRKSRGKLSRDLSSG